MQSICEHHFQDPPITDEPNFAAKYVLTYSTSSIIC